MPAIRRSKQSLVIKRNISIGNNNRRASDAAIIAHNAEYTDQIKSYNREDNERQIRYLKRIKRRLAPEILRIIYEYLTETTVKYLESRKQYRYKQCYLRLVNDMIVFNNWYFANRCQISRMIQRIPLNVLTRFTQTAVVVNCWKAVKTSWERGMYENCIHYNQTYATNPLTDSNVWIFEYELGKCISKLHQRIEGGNLGLITITQRLIKSIMYLADHHN